MQFGRIGSKSGFEKLAYHDVVHDPVGHEAIVTLVQLYGDFR